MITKYYNGNKTVEIDGNYYRARYDHDEGEWIEGWEYIEVAT